MNEIIHGLELNRSLGDVSIKQKESKFNVVQVISGKDHQGNSVDFGYRSIFNNLIIHFKGSGNTLSIDRHCRLSGRFVFDGDDQKITIQSNTSFEGVHLLASEGAHIKIGADCMFSYGIEIRNSDSHGIYDLKTKKRINFPEDIQIGNHVWLGMGVSVLPGVRIADGCIVGMKSVVTKGLTQRNAVYAGIPAKKIRDDVVWSRYKGDEFPQEVIDRLEAYEN